MGIEVMEKHQECVELVTAQSRLEACTVELQQRLNELLTALEAEDAAESALATRVHELQLAGVEGKNATEREAAVALATVPQREALVVAKHAARRARYAVD